MRRLRSASWPQVGLVLAVVLLAVIGLALLGAYFYLSRPTGASAGWSDPQASVQSNAVAPDLAALTLAGEPDDRIVRAALDAGERETAYATLAYGVLLPDTVRSGQWLVLANASPAGESDRTAVAFLAVVDLAALGPTLGDSARAEISLQAARGYATLQQKDVALLAVRQAEDVARHSPMLLPGQRRDILNQVAATYELLGHADETSRISANFPGYAAGPGIVVERTPPLLPTLRGEVVLPAEVASALSARQQAAASLAARWLSAEADARAALARSLGEALKQEDAARTAFYGTIGDLSLPNRLALLHDKVNWLTVKLRVSRGAYGVSLLPAWETEAQGIAGELSAAYTELINGYGQQLDTLDGVEAATARLELLRQGVLWVRLGLFPDQAAEDALSAQLAEASAELWSRQGGTGLRLVSRELQDTRFYLLAGPDSQ